MTSKSPFYSSMVKIILNSETPIDEKESLLVSLVEKETLEKDSQIQLQQKDIEFKDEKIKNISKELDETTLYKLHLQQLLTVRTLIEKYEDSFGEKLKKKNISRLDKWKEFLSSSDERFKPFLDSGLELEVVCKEIDFIYNNHSALIHSTKVLDTFNLEARGLLSANQLRIVYLIIKDSPWKDMITISSV